MRFLIAILVTCLTAAGGASPRPSIQAARSAANAVVEDAHQWDLIGAWVTGIETQQHTWDVDAWVAGVEAGEAAVVAAQRMVQAAPRAASSAPSVAVSGSCAAMAPPGFPAYIIQRESGGNPGAVNASSGALGCAQILPSWFDGACKGLSYAACWSLLWQGGAGASNWAPTR